MKLADIFWSKVGFGIIGFIAGSVWCFIFYPIFKSVQPELALFSLYKTFVLIFVLASMASEKFVGAAGFGALYAIYGYFVVLSGFQAGPTNWPRTTKEIIVSFALGIIAGVITLNGG